MELSHRFSVPTPVEETWAHFQDIASVAECFPGAQVSSAEGDSFSGSVKVKLGPIALIYNGSGTFVEKDGMVQPQPAPRFSRTEATLTLPPSKVSGEHTRAALTAWGIADVDDLIERGVAVQA